MADPGKDREVLVEQAAGAYRERDAHGRILAHAAWHDLDEAGRVEAFAVAEQTRALEAAMDPEGLSTTARAVLARIMGAAPRE
jgi:hypothetical protein